MFPFSFVVPPMAISGSLTESFCPNSTGRHLMFSLLLVQSFSRIVYFFFQLFTHLWIFSPCYLCLFLHDFSKTAFLVVLLFHPFHHFSFSLLFYLFSHSFHYTVSTFFCYTTSPFFASLLPSFQFFSPLFLHHLLPICYICYFW